MPKVFKNDTLRYKKGYNFKTNKKLRIWTWKNGVNIVKYNVNLRKLKKSLEEEDNDIQAKIRELYFNIGIGDKKWKLDS